MVYNESYADVARKIGDITQYGVRYERVERPGYIIGWSNNAGDWFLSRPVVKGTIETLDCNQMIVYGTKSHIQSLITEGLPVFFGYENSFEFSKQRRQSRMEREGRFVAPKNAERGWNLPVSPANVQKVVDVTQRQRQVQEMLERTLADLEHDLDVLERHMTMLEDDALQARTEKRKKVTNLYERAVQIWRAAKSILEDNRHVITPMIEEQAKPFANRAELLVTRIKRWEKYEAAKNSQYSGQRQKQEYFTFLSHVRGVPAFRRAGPADVVPVNRILQNIKAVTNRVNHRR